MTETAREKLDCGRFGTLVVEASGKGLTLVTLEGKREIAEGAGEKRSSTLDGLGITLRRVGAAELSKLASGTKAQGVRKSGAAALAREGARLICAYLSGDEGADAEIAKLPVDDEALPKGFTGDVLRLLRHVPYGTYITYGDLAEAAGSPKAARAVGMAMASNPVLIAVPCHRVYGAGGRLTGFGGGLGLKAALATLEQEN